MNVIRENDLCSIRYSQYMGNKEAELYDTLKYNKTNAKLITQPAETPIDKI